MNLIKKIVNISRVFLSNKTKLMFHNPPRADVVIIDGAEEEMLIRAILHGIPVATMNVRGGEDTRLYLSIGVLTRLIKNIYAGYGLVTSYFIACFHYIKPKVVVDYPHHSFLAKIAKEYRDAEFFSIRNGIVADILDVRVVDTAYHCEMVKQAISGLGNFHLFVFGQKDADIFSRIGLDKKTTGINVFALGSIIADYFRGEMITDTNKNHYEICFISQVDSETVRTNSGAVRDSRHVRIMLKEQTDVVIKHLNRYAIENDLTCAIQFRSPLFDEADERDYYLSMFDKEAKVTLLSRDDYFSSYTAVVNSRIILSLYSSLGYEAISWGKKAMFCPLGFKDVYKISSARFETDAAMWEWLVEEPDYECFSEKLGNLRTISDDEYISRISSIAKYLVNFEAKGREGAHNVIRGMILKVIKK